MSIPDIVETVEILAGLYAPPALPGDPFELVLWENIGYLIDDQRRRRLFDLFAETIGLSAAAIAQADDAALAPIARQGGMRPETRVGRWREIAAITLAEGGGDLAATLAALPLQKARALLRRFPAIGAPGADKILLFCGLAATPTVESNGLRVMIRLGLVEPRGAYDGTYRLAVAVLAEQGRPDGAWLRQAWGLLREHGQAVCKRGMPLCSACALESACPRRTAEGF